MRALLDLLMPSVCPACTTAPGPGICAACVAILPTWPVRCPWCAAPVRVDHRCDRCADGGLPFVARTVAPWAYADTMRQLVTRAKAGARPAAVAALTGVLPATPPADWPPAELIVPVPPSRGRRPGPHLATACARRLAQAWGLPWRPVLTTTRCAAEQHRLHGGARDANVDGLFRATGELSGGVVLVDDLLTTGATLSAAAKALRAAGATTVLALCLARTPAAGEELTRGIDQSLDGER